jgi:hypothetical protein
MLEILQLVPNLAAHIKNITECLEILQLVPNLIKCIVYNASSTSEASIPLQNTPIVTFPRLCSFSVLHSVRPDEIFKHLWLPIIHTLHVAYNDERKSGEDSKWFSQQPFIALLSSLHTLRRLEIDCLHVREDSAYIVRCLRSKNYVYKGREVGSPPIFFAFLLTRQTSMC